MKTEATTKEALRIIAGQKEEGKKRGHYFRPNIKVVLRNKQKSGRRSRARGRRR